MKMAATTQDVLTHHLSCLGDIGGTMADYTAEAALRPHVWRAETADYSIELGSDTFIVQNGKIVTQASTGKVSPKSRIS
jgi:hypothetical protein